MLPRKILKTNKAGEAISSHFLKAILPSVNEKFQRILLPSLLYALFKYLNLERYAYVCISLVSRYQCSDLIILNSDRKSAYY